MTRGARMDYTYDAVRRLTPIAQKNASGETLLQMDYTYTNDDLPLTITESGTLSGSATVTFTYDTRRRLIHEVRGNNPDYGAYDLVYTYDDGGNRTVKTEKIDAQTDRVTAYTYDRSSPAMYASNSNRLESYAVSLLDGQSQTPVSTTYYYYRNDADKDFGNVTRIITHPANTQAYSAIRFGYAFDGRTVSFVAGESWTWHENQPANCPTGYNIEWAREFRYDSGRARYLSRMLDANQLELGNIVATNQTWTDYDGDTSYGDFSLAAGNPPVVTNTKSYEPGLGEVNPWRSSGGLNTEYGMSDLLGTARGFTDRTGFPVEPAVYTAFGEIVWEPTGHKRYGYVGAWGYQQHDEFPFLHVGERYYDPSTGRFLQRDPMGVDGGINVYEYVGSMPTLAIDPLGLQFIPGPPKKPWDPQAPRQFPPSPSDVQSQPIPGLPHVRPLPGIVREGRIATDPRVHDPRGRGSKYRNATTGRFTRGPHWILRGWRIFGRIFDVLSLLQISGDNYEQRNNSTQYVPDDLLLNPFDYYVCD